MTAPVRLIGLLLRRHRVRILSWLVGIWVLVGIGAPSYQRTYPSLASREVLVEQMRAAPATRALYGVLRAPGRMGQLVAWEIGTFAVLLGALMAVLVAVAISRGEEESGATEVVRSVGVGAGEVLLASVVLLLGVCVVLGAGCSAILLAQTASSPELTVAGALAFGAVVAVASAVCGLIALAAAQVWAEAASARTVGLGLVGAAYALRAWADAGGPAVARWLSPLGWKDIVAPYSDDDVRPVLLGVVVAAGLVALTPVLARRRDHLAGLVPSRQNSTRRLLVRSLAAFDARRMMPRVLTWAVALALVGVVFGSLTGSIVGTLNDDARTRDLIRQMTGLSDVVAGWFSYAGLLVGVLIAIAAVGLVLAERTSESRGWTDVVLATGVSRRSPLATRLLLTGGALLLVLIVTALATAALAQLSYGSHHAALRAAGYILGQAPAALAATGISGLLLGLGHRVAPLAWGVITLAAALSFFGALLDAPAWVQRLSLFDHAGDPVGGDYPWTGQILLLVVALGSAAAGVALHRRRDLSVD